MPTIASLSAPARSSCGATDAKAWRRAARLLLWLLLLPPSQALASSAGLATLVIDAPGSMAVISDPLLPVVIGPNASGSTLVLPEGGTAPVGLQVAANGLPLLVQALPGTQLRIAQVDGQSALVVLQGWAQMVASSAGQPLALAGPVLLRADRPGTTIEAQPLAVAVLAGALLPPPGLLPELGGAGLLAGERLQVDGQGAVVAVTLGSLQGDAQQPGDAMAWTPLPASVRVDATAFARLDGPVARLSGASLAQGLEATPSGMLLLRRQELALALLPVQPITIDARLPDGLSFTPLGLLRWVRSGVAVQFAPAVDDLAGLATATAAVLPDAQWTLGAEGVLQLRTGGRAHVLRPGWAEGGNGSREGAPQIGVDERGRIYYLRGALARRQWLKPSLLSHTQASAILAAALPGARLSIDPAAHDGSLQLTLADQRWRLVPQWVLPEGRAAQVDAPAPGPAWWLGADGLLYLRLGMQVQGVRIED